MTKPCWTLIGILSVGATLAAQDVWSAHPCLFCFGLHRLIGFFYLFCMAKMFRPRWPMIVLPGILLNTIVIISNQGFMPVDAELFATRSAPRGYYTPISDATILPELGDVLPFGFSLGDVLILAGVLVMLGWTSVWEPIRYRRLNRIKASIVMEGEAR